VIGWKRSDIIIDLLGKTQQDLSIQILALYWQHSFFLANEAEPFLEWGSYDLQSNMVGHRVSLWTAQGKLGYSWVLWLLGKIKNVLVSVTCPGEEESSFQGLPGR
jgi:hypothetical protein